VFMDLTQPLGRVALPLNPRGQVQSKYPFMLVHLPKHGYVSVCLHSSISTYNKQALSQVNQPNL
jgi:hypothetical protein